MSASAVQLQFNTDPNSAFKGGITAESFVFGDPTPDVWQYKYKVTDPIGVISESAFFVSAPNKYNIHTFSIVDNKYVEGAYKIEVWQRLFGPTGTPEEKVYDGDYVFVAHNVPINNENPHVITKETFYHRTGLFTMQDITPYVANNYTINLQTIGVDPPAITGQGSTSASGNFYSVTATYKNVSYTGQYRVGYSYGDFLIPSLTVGFRCIAGLIRSFEYFIESYNSICEIRGCLEMYFTKLDKCSCEAGGWSRLAVDQRLSFEYAKSMVNLAYLYYECGNVTLFEDTSIVAKAFFAAQGCESSSCNYNPQPFIPIS